MASASGSTDPRIAVPSQSVIDRFAASTTAGGTAASSRPSTKSTSASITGVLLVVIVISSFHGTRPQREASRKGSMSAMGTLDTLRYTKLPLTAGSGAVPALGFGTLIP